MLSWPMSWNPKPYLEGHWDLVIMEKKMEATIIFRVWGLESGGLGK